MATSILPTKLFIPRFSGEVVPRQRLFNHLDSGLDRVLTLVSAPAGYGKSTLLSEWVKQAKIPVAWLSLDTNDRDPVRFWSHFIASLATLSYFKGGKLGDLQPEEEPILPFQTSRFLDELIKEIILISEKFVVILDDFHTVSDGEIPDGLFYLLEKLSTGSSKFHLILSSRTDPPWPLARFRVSNQINEIRVKDLRFTIEEATQLFKHVMDVDLAPTDIMLLEKRTEGWVAGLQMAAISLRGREDISKFIQSFGGSNRFIMDYLLEEVLNRQPQDFQNFLLKTSILEKLNGDLADFILINSTSLDHQQKDYNSQSILSTLEQNNLFLIALDDQRNWFRYHHLFADLLQNRLRARHPEIIPVLHQQASIWFSQEGYLEEAIDHAIKTNDLNFATRQIETHVIKLIRHGNISLTRKWIRSLPDEIIRPRPILCLAQAWAYANHATIELAEELLTRAEAALQDETFLQDDLDQDTEQLLSTYISVLRVVIARVRGISPQNQQEMALEILNNLEPSENIAAQATLYYRLGLCYLDLGKLDQADHVFSQAVKLARTSGNYYTVHAGNYGRMVIANLKGRLSEIVDIYHSNQITKSQSAEQQRLIGIDLIMLGSVQYEWNNLKEADTNLSTGLELCEKIGISELTIKGQYAQARVKIALGQKITLPDLVGMAERSHPELKAYAAARQVQIALLLASQSTDSNLLDFVYQWADRQQLAFKDPFSYDWEIQEKLIYARVLCHRYQSSSNPESEEKLEASVDFFTEQLSRLEELGWNGILIEGYLVKALTLQALGRHPDALSSLERALNLAESQKYMRIFIDEGEPLRCLLQQALKAGICKGYTKELLSSLDHPKKVSQSLKKVETTELVDPLSEKEFQILPFLNTRLSVPEIADEIHLAPSTVRTHVQNIYRKLNTHNRIETLRKAKDLGLL